MRVFYNCGMWRKTVSTSQAAKMLGKHPETVRRMIERGELVGRRIDPACAHSPLRVSIESVEAYRKCPTDPRECSVNEAAALMDVSRVTILRMVKRGSVKFRRVRRAIRLLRESLPVLTESHLAT